MPPHRGPLHAPRSALLFSAGCFAATSLFIGLENSFCVAVSGGAGYLLHLSLDWLNSKKKRILG